jgi:hypothetical protein
LVWMIVETSGNVQYPHSSSVQAQMYILFFWIIWSYQLSLKIIFWS